MELIVMLNKSPTLILFLSIMLFSGCANVQKTNQLNSNDSQRSKTISVEYATITNATVSNPINWQKETIPIIRNTDDNHIFTTQGTSISTDTLPKVTGNDQVLFDDGNKVIIHTTIDLDPQKLNIEGANFLEPGTKIEMTYEVDKN